MTENESKIYLAALELGPSTVQHLAGKAAVVRPTAYVAIGGLVKHGLMSHFTKGKKIYFSVENPETLKKLLTAEQEKINKKEASLSDLLPNLLGLFSGADKPRIKLFEGIEGLGAVQDFLISVKPGHVDEMVSYDDLKELIQLPGQKEHEARILKSKIGGRVLYNNSMGPRTKKNAPGWTHHWVSQKNFPIHGDITIFDKYIAMASFGDVYAGIIIESKALADSMRTMFELAWQKSNEIKNKG